MSCFAETSFGSLNKAGEELCGDKVALLRDESGTLLVLSDGLGSGVKANILSSLTTKIITSMLSNGADIRDVVETIADTLPVCKERKVAYATFSVIHVDQHGSAYMVEFDNPAMILLRDGKQVLPPWKEITISGKKVREARMQLVEGDSCVMFSDGVVHAGVGNVLNLDWQYEQVVQYLMDIYSKEAGAYEIQSRLLAACDSLYMGQPGDDATVAVLHLRTPLHAYVMIGPPQHREEDRRRVADLMAAPGLKVVCGGTTSQIVSKIIGKELRAHLNDASPDVPPIAELEGIHLVTEGLLTLQKTLELLKLRLKGDWSNPTRLREKQDGAHLLADVLVNQATTITIVAGRAANPACVSGGEPPLLLKLRVVKEIVHCLKAMGKHVELRYC